ncbi:acyltransferase [Bradyrhizobium sp. CCGUVB4N]|uniref:acyltransferase family protein n=1 Tax=Bradyrhizobium sp. CCGUVB4N TaxID=2949631 RepID=UPI0020B23D1B|nr:acyltransferase [Bradyrhizobium sp. CCGUVB4N]MCP3384505.1 acyltransferase [Bradyrhizobium sp. CCGUVB4N]
MHGKQGDGRHSQGGASHRILPEIEVLRAIAILFVLIAHHRTAMWWLPPTLESYLNFAFGVDLFFCVSGFVITRAFYRDFVLAAGKGAPAYWRVVTDFWIRRAFRIMPLAWLWLLIPIVMSLVYNRSGAYFSFFGNVGDFLAAALNVYNFHYAYCTSSPNLWCGSSGVYWSLSLEEQFYLAFPLLVLLPRRAMAVVLAGIVAWMAMRERTSLTWMTRFDAISLGVLIALFKQSAADVAFTPYFLQNRFVRWPLLVILLFALAAVGGGPGLVTFFPVIVTLICGALVYIASFNGGYLLAPGLLRSILVWIGARSFGLYLMHNPVIAFVRETWERAHPGQLPDATMKAVIVLAIVGLLALLSDLSFRYFETPLRRYGKQLVDRRNAAAASTADDLVNPDSGAIDAASTNLAAGIHSPLRREEALGKQGY